MSDIRKYIDILKEIEYNPRQKSLEEYIDADAVAIVYAVYDALYSKSDGFMVPPWRLFDYNTISDIQNEIAALDDLMYQFKSHNQIYKMIQLMNEYISEERTNFPDDYLKST